MAENNSVPLGQAGTGAAFLLGDNEALARSIERSDRDEQYQRQQDLFAQKSAQAAQKQRQDDYIKNALNIKAGLIFPDVDEGVRKVTEAGKELYQQGINPWQPYTGSDPKVKEQVDALQRDRLHVEEQAQRRDLLQPLLLKETTSYDPNKHTQESFDRLNKFAQLPASEAFKMQMPTLQPKLNPNEVLAKVKIAPESIEKVVGNQRIKYEGADPVKAKKSIVTQLKNEPSINAFLKEDLGISGYTVEELEKLPKSYEAIKQDAIEEYNGSPEYRAALATQGILSQEQFEQVAVEGAKKAFQAKQKWDGFVNEVTDRKVNEIGIKNSVTNDFSAQNAENAAERLRIARQKANASSAAKEAPTYVQDLYNRVISEEDGAAQELFDELKGGVMNRGGVLFRGKPSMRKDKDGNVVFTIPEVVGEANDEGERKVIKGALTFKYNPNNPEEAVRVLNNMRNSYVTTDKQTLSKVMTPSGKGKVPNGRGEEGFKKQVSDQDKAALNWLKANPNAPQAKAIRASLKSKGLIK